MTFFSMMNAQFSAAQYLELVCRIVAAAVCGGVVGIERSRRFKDAGVRTHCMVACAAAIMMIISKYGFADLIGAEGALFAGTRGADPARIAAQIVSGVSFLGVGIIYRDRNFATRGLTTAAGIWAVAGIGMAIGAGLYVVGLFSTVFVVLLQWFMHRVVIGNDRYIGAEMQVLIEDDAEAIEKMYAQFETWGAVVSETSVAREDGLLRYEFEVKLPSKELHREITRLLTSHPAIRSVKINDPH